MENTATIIEEELFEQTTLEEADYVNCKVADCTAEQGGRFKDCVLTGSLFVNCVIEDCRIRQCEFEDCVIIDSKAGLEVSIKERRTLS